MSNETTYVAKKPDHRGFIAYSAEENQTWSILLARQMARVDQATTTEFVDGLRQLELPVDRAPQCAEVSRVLGAATGWKVTPVAALIELDVFFQMLARREFPAASFLRRRDELNYLREPDLFHEIFGHAPLLCHPEFARFTQKYGELGVTANAQEREVLARLYWFTIEFGLIRKSNDDLRVYGAGIASSISETTHALESEDVDRRPFELDEVLRHDYRIDKIQPTYFVLDSFEQLFATVDDDLMAKVRAVCEEDDLERRSAA